MTLVELFTEAATEVHGPLAVPLDASTSIESLDIDSMDLIEITMIMEESLDIIFEPSELEGVTTVGDLLAILAKLASARSSQP